MIQSCMTLYETFRKIVSWHIAYFKIIRASLKFNISRRERQTCLIVFTRLGHHHVPQCFCQLQKAAIKTFIVATELLANCDGRIERGAIWQIQMSRNGCIYKLYNGQHFPALGPPSNTMFLGSSSLHPKQDLNPFSRFRTNFIFFPAWARE